jgi:hypothetical protein
MKRRMKGVPCPPSPFLSVFPTFAKSVDPGGFFLLSGKNIY